MKCAFIKGLSAPLHCMENARTGIAWGALGAAETCYRIAKEYTINRLVFTLTCSAA